VAADDPARALKKATGGLADVVVDVTAKAPAALAQAVAMTRPGARFVIAGTRGFGTGTPGFEPDVVRLQGDPHPGRTRCRCGLLRGRVRVARVGQYPFATFPRQVATLDAAEDLILTMAGEGSAPPPVHGVLVP